MRALRGARGGFGEGRGPALQHDQYMISARSAPGLWCATPRLCSCAGPRRGG